MRSEGRVIRGSRVGGVKRRKGEKAAREKGNKKD